MAKKTVCDACGKDRDIWGGELLVDVEREYSYTLRLHGLIDLRRSDGTLADLCMACAGDKMKTSACR